MIAQLAGGRRDAWAARRSTDPPATAGTCLYSRLRPTGAAWQVTFSSAGHLPPALLHDGVATLLETPPDLLLGVDAATTRSDHRVRLEPGDVLLLYTDGLVEERRSPLDDRLALLTGQLESLAGCSVEQLVDTLLARLVQAGQDDVALLAVQVPGGPCRDTPPTLHPDRHGQRADWTW